MDAVPVENLMFFLIALPVGSLICDLGKRGRDSEKRPSLTQKSMSK
jgi:hypothetical protein